jgi:hypothetical protein
MNKSTMGSDASRVLFVDDGDIASKSGVERVIHPAQKYEGNPVVLPDQPWENWLVMGGTVRKEGDTLRMWYQQLGDGGYLNLYAKSKDGINWDKPILGQYQDQRGSLQNNIYFSRLALPSGERPRERIIQDHNQSVLYTPHMGEGRRYTMLSYGQQGGTPYDGYHLAFSDDGIRWTDGPKEPVIPSHADVGWFMFDDRDMRFHGIVKKFLIIRERSRRSILWTESEDGFNWKMPKPALIPDIEDDEWAEGREDHYSQFYGMPVMRYESVILGLLQVFRSTESKTSDGFTHVQLASSRDGRRWQRVGDRRPILERGEAGEFDWGVVQTGHSLVLDGDVVRMYYMGINTRHGRNANGVERLSPDGKEKAVSIGMATWPIDRIVGLRTGSEGGSVRVTGRDIKGELHVNANAAGGSLVAEVIGEDGRPLPGLDAGSCLPLAEDSLDHTVRWRDGASPAQLDGKAVEIDIRLTNAEIFSIW